MAKNLQLQPGTKIDKLTLLRIKEERYYDNLRHTPVWECICDCGKTCEITEFALRRSNHIHSCGCIPKKNLQMRHDSEHMSMCGKARAEKRNKDGVNVDMLFRDKLISSNTSGVQGVSWAKSCSKWHVYVGYKNKRANLGYFDNLEFAKQVRQQGIEAVKNGNFEEFYQALRGKPY